MKHIPRIFLALGMAVLSSFADSKNEPAQPAPAKQDALEVSLLRAECMALRRMLAAANAAPMANQAAVAVKKDATEVERLRAECQALRKMLAAPAPQPAPGAPPAHWLTLSSGVRHNATCPRYEKTNGRPCAPNEGKACGTCGG